MSSNTDSENPLPLEQMTGMILEQVKGVQQTSTQMASTSSPRLESTYSPFPSCYPFIRKATFRNVLRAYRTEDRSILWVFKSKGKERLYTDIQTSFTVLPSPPNFTTARENEALVYKQDLMANADQEDILTSMEEFEASVKEMQRVLIDLGYHLGSSGVDENGVDGDFRETTKIAVKRFQQDYGLHVDGIVGRNTYAAFNVAIKIELQGLVNWRISYPQFIILPERPSEDKIDLVLASGNRLSVAKLSWQSFDEKRMRHVKIIYKDKTVDIEEWDYRLVIDLIYTIIKWRGGWDKKQSTQDTRISRPKDTDRDLKRILWNLQKAYISSVHYLSREHDAFTDTDLALLKTDYRVDDFHTKVRLRLNQHGYIAARQQGETPFLSLFSLRQPTQTNPDQLDVSFGLEDVLVKEEDDLYQAFKEEVLKMDEIKHEGIKNNDVTEFYVLRILHTGSDYDENLIFLKATTEQGAPYRFLFRTEFKIVFNGSVIKEFKRKRGPVKAYYKGSSKRSPIDKEVITYFLLLIQNLKQWVNLLK